MGLSISIENCTRFEDENQALSLFYRYMVLVVLVGNVDNVDKRAQAAIYPYI
jgi:hypothetical protein